MEKPSSISSSKSHDSSVISDLSTELDVEETVMDSHLHSILNLISKKFLEYKSHKKRAKQQMSRILVLLLHKFLRPYCQDILVRLQINGELYFQCFYKVLHEAPFECLNKDLVIGLWTSLFGQVVVSVARLSKYSKLCLDLFQHFFKQLLLTENSEPQRMVVLELLMTVGLRFSEVSQQKDPYSRKQTRLCLKLLLQSLQNLESLDLPTEIMRSVIGLIEELASKKIRKLFKISCSQNDDQMLETLVILSYKLISKTSMISNRRVCKLYSRVVSSSCESLDYCSKILGMGGDLNTNYGGEVLLQKVQKVPSSQIEDTLNMVSILFQWIGQLFSHQEFLMDVYIRNDFLLLRNSPIKFLIYRVIKVTAPHSFPSRYFG